MKAIIPVAGFGTRMLPATKSIPKEMLPLIDKPLIQYIVEECAAAGIKEIVLVTHNSKQAIENHFDTQFELESNLKAKNKFAVLAEVQATCPADVSIISIRQHEAKGLGHAVLQAYPVIGDEPFAVLLPDVILKNPKDNPRSSDLRSMLDSFEKSGISQILLEKVCEEDVSKYGIADLNGLNIDKGESAAIASFVEKPEVGSAPSNLAVVGRYVFSSGIWDYLKQTSVGAGGEIQLTDAMDSLLQSESLVGFCMEGKSYDCGDKLGYTKAFIDFSLNDKRFSSELMAYVKSMS